MNDQTARDIATRRPTRPPRGASRVTIVIGIAACVLITAVAVWWLQDQTALDPSITRSSITLPVVAPKPTTPAFTANSRAETVDSPVAAPRPTGNAMTPPPLEPRTPQHAPHWLRTLATSVENSARHIHRSLEPPIPRIWFALQQTQPISVRVDQQDWRRLPDTLEETVSLLAPQLSRKFADHPLAIEPLREGVTLSLELEAALAADAPEDAARLIPALADLNGLVPALGDPARFVPPSAVITEAIEKYPELAGALEAEFGPAALQTVRQAIAANDRIAIGEIAIRYHGTQAGSIAHRRLGKRALALGNLHEASHHFQAARTAFADREQSELDPEIHLAQALAGTFNPQTPLTKPVTLGTATIAPDDWKALLLDLNETHQVDNSSSTPLSLPASGPRQAHQRLHIADEVGRDPTDEAFQNFDWPGRQLAVTVDHNIAYISNRFQLVALEIQNHNTLWAAKLGSEQGDAHAWPNTPFKPLVAGERIIARRLLGRGPELAAFAADDDGTLLWRSHPELTIASDPWLHNRRLWAITTPHVRRGNRPLPLSLSQFRLDDGKRLASVPLIVLNPTASDSPAVHVTPMSHGFCLHTRGAIGRFDYKGQTRWLRRLHFLPAEIDPHPEQVAIVPPLVADDSIYLSIPGTRDILRLDADSGQLVWKRPISRLSRLITANEKIVIARADDHLLGFAPKTGLLKWKNHHHGLLDGALADATTLLVAQAVPGDDEKHQLHLAWLELATGNPRGETTIMLNDIKAQAAGPFFLADGREYLFLGSRPHTGERTLVELSPPPRDSALSKRILKR